jgi:hypothetical protein
VKPVVPEKAFATKSANRDRRQRNKIRAYSITSPGVSAAVLRRRAIRPTTVRFRRQLDALEPLT